MIVKVLDCLKATSLTVSGSYVAYPGATVEQIPQKKINEKSTWTFDVPFSKVAEITIKLVNGRNSSVNFSHTYKNWDKDINIMWLRPGNFGDDTVFWIADAPTDYDYWHNGGEVGKQAAYARHKENCGNIAASVGTAKFDTSSSTGNSSRITGNSSRVTGSSSRVTGTSYVTGFSSPSPSTNDAERRAAINKYMKSMVANNSTIQDYLDKDARKEVQTSKYRIVKEKVSLDDVIEFQSNLNFGDVFPGQLLVIDDKIGTNRPTEVFCNRGSVMLSIDLPISGSSVKVVADSAGKLGPNVNKAINAMKEEFTKSGKSVRANFEKKWHEASSSDELRLSVGASGSLSSIKASANFEMNSKNYTKYNLIDFSQTFFTVKAEFDASDWSKLFADTVTVADIKAACNDRPMIFVDSVRYGRRCHLTETISCSSNDMLQSANISASSFSVENKYSKKNTKFKYNHILKVEGGNDAIRSKMIAADEALTAQQTQEASATKESAEKDFEIAMKEANQVRQMIRKLESEYLSKQIDGKVIAEIDGAILSYSSKTLAGASPVTTVFMKGQTTVNRLIPNTGLKFEFHNSAKATNMFVTVEYDIVNPATNTVVNHKVACKEAKVSPRDSLKTVTTLPQNVANLYVYVYNGRNHAVNFSHTYDAPCADVRICYLRPGRIKTDGVDWYYDGESIFNGGEV